MSIEELKKEILANFGEDCPSSNNCGNEGTLSEHGCNGTVEDCSRTCPVPVQCEFCYTVPTSKFALSSLIDNLITAVNLQNAEKIAELERLHEAEIKEAVEREKNRVCKNCKYLDGYLMCSNPKVLNGSNFIPEFINAKQAENFGCTKWELSTPQQEKGK